MHLLADECVDMAIVRTLRDAGHDVLAIAEERPGTTDRDVATLARDLKRVVITEDRDFGRLVYAQHEKTLGVVYLRYSSRLRAFFARYLVELIEERSEALQGAFVVVEPGQVRISRLPEA